MSVVCDIEDHPGGYREALKEALETGPYGKCVYQTDNDVVDHQVVNMEFENEATASFTMNAFTKDMRRETRICGTRCVMFLQTTGCTIWIIGTILKSYIVILILVIGNFLIQFYNGKMCTF